jgi:hypothetical protein
MANDLIDLLNRHGHRSPDEIVRQINFNGWVEGKHITVDHLSAYFACVRWDECRWYMSNEQWRVPPVDDRGIERIQQLLRNHWVKPYDQYILDRASRPPQPFGP